jgi:hypothetical protein
MTKRRLWTRIIVVAAVAGLACEQAWRHGRAYLFAQEFAVVEPGKIYRGAWQRNWPMTRIIHDDHIKTIVALAHPADHVLAIREKELADAQGVRWVHIPIVDERGTGDPNSIFDPIERAAAVIADPSCQPVYFHCHHGVNRASMVHMAYRMLYCGWTLDEATAEISRTFGLRAVNHGADYRIMTEFYRDRVVPRREALARGEAAKTAK